MATFGNQVVI